MGPGPAYCWRALPASSHTHRLRARLRGIGISILYRQQDVNTIFIELTSVPGTRAFTLVRVWL